MKTKKEARIFYIPDIKTAKAFAKEVKPSKVIKVKEDDDLDRSQTYAIYTFANYTKIKKAWYKYTGIVLQNLKDIPKLPKYKYDTELGWIKD